MECNIPTTEPEAQKRVEIDVAFAALANDAEYLAEALKITDEFAEADWEAY